MHYIRQTGKSDCGITCVKILLANIFNSKEYLYIPRNESKKNYSFLEMRNLASRYGVNLVGVKFEDDLDLRKINSFPIIISLDLSENIKHAVVLLKRRGNKFLVLDPSEGKKWISNLSLVSFWDGTALIVESIAVKQNKPTLFSNLVHKGHLLILYALQIIASLSLVTSTYFIDGTYNSLIYCGLFIGVYLLSEIFFRLYLNKINKLISKNILDRISITPSDSYDFLHRLVTFKKLYFINKITIITNLVLGGFVSFIFIMNNPLNGIIIGATFLLGLLDAFAFRKIIKRKEDKLSVKENDNSISNSIYNFRSHIFKIEDKAAGIVNLSSFFRILEIILLAGSVVAVTLLSKILSTVSLVFYLVLAFYIFKMFSVIFSFKERNEELDIAKTKLANLTYHSHI